jgi:hypothetical protein
MWGHHSWCAECAASRLSGGPAFRPAYEIAGRLTDEAEAGPEPSTSRREPKSARRQDCRPRPLVKSAYLQRHKTSSLGGSGISPSSIASRANCKAISNAASFALCPSSRTASARSRRGRESAACLRNLEMSDATSTTADESAPRPEFNNSNRRPSICAIGTSNGSRAACCS